MKFRKQNTHHKHFIASGMVLASLVFTGNASPARLPQNPQASQEKPQSANAFTFNDAIKMAIASNGTIKAAYADLKAAEERKKQAYSAFLPTVTPNFTYNSDRSTFRQSGVYGANQVEGGTSSINGNWQLLDLGERNLNYLSAVRSKDGQYYQTVQTVRQTLFNVQFQYYEALRAQNLEKVAQAQVLRTQTILEQTQASVAAGSAAQISILQAKADVANAQVSLLQSVNLSTTNIAQLKGLIGYPANQELTNLADVNLEDKTAGFTNLSQAISQGVEQRPDLLSQKKFLDSQDYSKRALEQQAGLTMSLSVDYTQTVTPFPLQSRFATLSFSYPLFDGGRSRSVARQAGDQEESAVQLYNQAIRSAKAEIESDYLTYDQNSKRLVAAQSAQEAASENYKAAVESQKLGSSTLIDVITAQVSLVTAESNLIQATYDFDEANLRLQLATGRPLSGTNLP